jgi:hypothetical protein
MLNDSFSDMAVYPVRAVIAAGALVILAIVASVL